jgi:hypothetical protein
MPTFLTPPCHIINTSCANQREYRFETSKQQFDRVRKSTKQKECVLRFVHLHVPIKKERNCSCKKHESTAARGKSSAPSKCVAHASANKNVFPKKTKIEIQSIF